MTKNENEVKDKRKKKSGLKYVFDVASKPIFFVLSSYFVLVFSILHFNFPVMCIVSVTSLAVAFIAFIGVVVTVSMNYKLQEISSRVNDRNKTKSFVFDNLVAYKKIIDIFVV